MKIKADLLETKCYYHIYNRANGSEKIFLNEENYLFFLQKYIEYIHPIAETYCYCLMPNHFHFLI
ncbi:MAG TPA: transposase, partial [Vicingus sp.]|nr:transposase [Vicingus sp.]